MNDFDVIDQIKSAVGPAPEPPPYRMDAIRGRARAARQRRWTELIGTTAMAVALVGGLVAIGGRPASLSPQREISLLTAAADKAASARTARIEFEMTVTGVPTAHTRMTGELDFENEAARMGNGEEQMLVVGNTIYTPISESNRRMAEGRLDGKLWIRHSWPAFGTSTIGGPFTSRPEQLLDMLRDVAGDPQRLGREEIRGTATTGYRFDLGRTLARYVPMDSGSATADVFLDEDGLPRRIVVDMKLPTGAVPGADPSGLSMRMSMDLYDYGATLEPITHPPTAQVIDQSAYFAAMRFDCLAGEESQRESCFSLDSLMK